tara:strand:- start:25 stop:252 length:228 start_codon:yes stop_codon:yes gene_type:complete
MPRKNKAALKSHHVRTLNRLRHYKVPRNQWTKTNYTHYYHDAKQTIEYFTNMGWIVTVEADEDEGIELYNSLPTE